MRVVDQKALKKQLAKYLRLAAGGETVLVTIRNRVVAELVPPGSPRRGVPAVGKLEDAVREGLISPPLFPPGEPPPRKAIVPFQDLMDELQHDREDR